ncbi:MAG: MerR family transcriptional regulator [bacterium]|nr:MerR family transcriptional regulator [bacterium]
MPRRAKDERFTISVVAEMFDIHPQTLRMYEREGLIEPSRSSGKTRLYSRGDIERLEVILTLTREMGVNLAGVDVIMELREKLMAAMNRVGELEELLESDALRELRDQMEHATADMKALIPARGGHLIRLQRRKT